MDYINAYVHRHINNYYIASISPISDHNIPPDEEIKEYIRIKNEIKDKYFNDTQDLRETELENQYKALIGHELKDIDGNDLLISVVDSINKEIEKYGHKVSLDNVLEGISSSRELSEKCMEYWNKLNDVSNKFIEIGDEQTLITKSRVENIANTLDNILNSVQGEFPDEIKAELEMRSLSTDVEEIRQDIKKILTVIKYSKNENLFGRQMKKNRSAILELKSYVDALINVPLGYFCGSQANVQGIIGEILAASLNYSAAIGCAEALQKANLTELLNDTELDIMLGAKNIYTIRDKKSGKAIMDFDSKKDIVTYVKGDYANFKIEYHTSKTDVILSLKNSNYKASVKNYRSFKNLTVVDGTPLENILNTFGEDFKFHFANLLQDNENRNKYKENMLELIKLRSLEIGLKGYTASREPGVFVVFSKGEPEKVRVYNINALIKRLIKDIDEKPMNTNNYSYIADFGQIELENNLKNVPYRENFGEMTQKALELFQAHKVHVMIKALPE